MHRLLLLSCVIFALGVKAATAEDYLLRLEAIGFVDHPAADPKPQEKVLNTIEVIARPNAPFHAKFQQGNETILLNVQIEPSDEGRFDVAFQYRHTIERGAKVRNEKSMSTTIRLALDEPFTTGKLISAGVSESADGNKIAVKSQFRLRLVLTKYQPAKK